jgi:hypothetical protein
MMIILFINKFLSAFIQIQFSPNLAFEKLAPFKTVNNVKHVSKMNIYFSSSTSTFKL